MAVTVLTATLSTTACPAIVPAARAITATTALVAAAPVAATPIHIEAETGELRGGTAIGHDIAGFTGTGYVGNFTAPDSAVHFHVTATAAGIYDVQIRYHAPSEKGFDLFVNGKKASGMFPPSAGNGFSTQDAGKIELQAGDNEIGIERGWGYYEIDSLDIVPAPAPPKLRKPSTKLSDPDATPKTKALMRYLVGQYGAATLSGQHTGGDTAYIEQTTGKSPAIFTTDLIEYSPTRVAHGSNPSGLPEEVIGQYQKGHIVGLMWHWNAPTDLIDKKYQDDQGKDVDRSWYRGFYTEATTFDVEKALADPNSDDYKLLLRDIDAIAEQLKKVSAADVPILWRPLHEAEGGWFWWGAKGPEPFKKLWHLMHDRLTNYHHLHNLIWVYTAGTKMAWYPGDDEVDIVGADAYPSDVTDPLSSTWEGLLQQFGGKKLIALTEFGGVPDVERMNRFGVRWSYFDSWTGDLGPKKVPADELRRLYSEPGVVDLDRVSIPK